VILKPLCKYNDFCKQKSASDFLCVKKLGSEVVGSHLPLHHCTSMVHVAFSVNSFFRKNWLLKWYMSMLKKSPQSNSAVIIKLLGCCAVESCCEGEGKCWCSFAVHPSCWYWSEHTGTRTQQWCSTNCSWRRRVPSPCCNTKHLWNNCSQCCTVDIWQLRYQEGYCMPPDWRLKKEVWYSSIYC